MAVQCIHLIRYLGTQVLDSCTSDIVLFGTDKVFDSSYLSDEVLVKTLINETDSSCVFRRTCGA